jgi:hypothetical protein
MAVTPSKTLAPNGALVDLQTGRATPPFNNYLNNLTQNANAAAAGTVATPVGGGLSGGGLVADGISLIIAPNGVSDAMIRQSTAYSVIGRAFGTDGDVADITATADNRVLARIGGVLAFTDTSLIPATVADGNYGDITVSGTGTVWTINNTVVTFAKIQDIATDRLIGRDTAGAGSAEQLTVGGGVEFTGTGGIQTSAFTGDATKAVGGTALTLATVNLNTGTWGSATQAPVITLDGKGRATAASNVTITPAVGSITGLGANVAAFLATPSSANLAAAVTDETGSGSLVFSASPTFTGTMTAATIDFSGTLKISGTAFASLGGGYYIINNPGGGNAIVIGNGDPSTYYDNTTHNFRAAGGGSTNCSISASGIAPISTTTASAANVFQSATGTVLLRSTSSRRYKANIKALSASDADLVLGLRPITYTSKATADDPKRLHWGLIAEEADKTLPVLVNYDGRGRPDGLQYERVIVGLLSVVKRLDARVKALETLQEAAA